MKKFLEKVSYYDSLVNLSVVSKVKIFLLYPVFLAHANRLQTNSIIHFSSKLILGLSERFKVKQCCIDQNGRSRYFYISLSENDLSNFKEIFMGGEYDSSLVDGQVKTLVDLGANKGLASLFFSIVFKLDKVVLLEANPRLAKELSAPGGSRLPGESIVLNKCVTNQNVESLKFIVSDNHRDSSLSGIGINNGEEILVPTIKLKEVLDHVGDIVDLVKMDIEGEEFKLLKTSPLEFKRMQNLFLELHGDKEQCEDFRSELSDLGFDIIVLADYCDRFNCQNVFAKRRGL